jgi:hypothetical protein
MASMRIIFAALISPSPPWSAISCAFKSAPAFAWAGTGGRFE